jgi:hypothetical protein
VGGREAACTRFHTHACTRAQEKLESGQYGDPKDFKHDVNLVWHNCMTYNAVSNPRGGGGGGGAGHAVGHHPRAVHG